jgi:RNA polymerase sigma factor (sigma-70 family)
MSDKDGNLIIRPDWPPEQGAWLDRNVDAEALRLYAFKKVGDAHVAHDIVEDFLDCMAAKSMEELERIEKPRHYAQAAIRNRVSNRHRDQAKFVTRAAGFDPPAETQSPQIQVGSEPEAVELLAMLPERDATALFLCKYCGYTSEEAAKEMGISASLVRKRVAAAIRFLNPDGPVPDRRSFTSRIRSLFKRKESKRDE